MPDDHDAADIVAGHCIEIAKWIDGETDAVPQSVLALTEFLSTIAALPPSAEFNSALFADARAAAAAAARELAWGLGVIWGQDYGQEGTCN